MVSGYRTIIEDGVVEWVPEVMAAEWYVAATGKWWKGSLVLGCR